MKVRKLIAVAMLAAVAFVASPAAAVPIISGESDLRGTILNSAVVRLDWQVFAPGDASAPLGSTAFFQYVYQLEATTGLNDSGFLNDVGSVTITFGATAVSFTSLATAAGNLVIDSEVNPFDGHALTCCVVPSGDQLTSGTATWFFDPKIPHDGQSQLLIGLSPLPPIFGNASALDGLPGSPWSTAAPGGELIPVPGRVPEPGTVLLLGIGLVGIASQARRLRGK